MTRHTRKFIRFGAAACAALLLGLPAPWAQVIDPDLQSVLDGLRPQDKISVIVRFVQKVDLDQFQEQDKGLLRAQIVHALKAQSSASQSAVEHILSGGGVGRRASLWGINGLAITASSQKVLALAHNPNVESITLDVVVEGPKTEAGTGAIPEWNLDAIRAPELWAAGTTGAGVVVAGMDTGVDADHPDLSASYRGGANSWLDVNGIHTSPYDGDGHGTQTMGIAVGGSAGGTAIGVAPGAQWIAVKIFDYAGNATLSGIHQGFQWLLDPDGDPNTDDAADVVNNSWSLANIGGCALEFEQDIQTLEAAQIAVVFAGGNYGDWPGTSVSPANNPSGFAVGATDSSDLIAGFSSSGPSACDGSTYPEVVAPGVAVRTADLTFGGAYPDSYASVVGTSFATPHVAGAMALLLSAYPSATVGQLEQSLKDTAVDGGAAGPDNAYGYGRIDVVAASGWLANPPGPVCTDLDLDGFFAESGCGTQLDCNDLDAGINPAACDIKSDGIDQDCDGRDRTRGKACPVSGGNPTPTPTPTPTTPPSTTPTPTPTPPPDTSGSEGKGKTCSDNIDNDGDGAIDCADSDCANNKACK